jgi:hypothetical protein
MNEHEADGSPGLENAAQVVVNDIMLKMSGNRSNLNSGNRTAY